MKWIKEKAIYIVLIFININMILRIIQKCIYINDFNYVFTTLLFLVGVFIYWFYNFLLKKPIYKLLFTLSIIIVSGIYYLKNFKIINTIFNKHIIKNIDTLDKLIYNKSITYFYQYKFLLVLIIPISTALIIWVTCKFINNFILFVTLSLIITLWFWNCYAVVKQYLFLYLFISSFTFIIGSYIKKVKEFKNKGVKVYLKLSYVLIYAITIAFIVSKVSLILPQEYMGKDSSIIGNYFQNKFAPDSSGKILSVKNMYSLSSSGYTSNDKRLGGPIALNHQEAFTVKSDKPYYLKGVVKDFYDGIKWGKTNENYGKAIKGKNMPIVMRQDNIIGIKDRLRIYPNKKFKTNTIFVPNHTFNVEGIKETLFYDEVPTVLSEKQQIEPYDVDFHRYSESIDTIEDVNNYIINSNNKNDMRSTTYTFPMDYFISPKYNKNPSSKNNTQFEERFSYRNSESYLILKNYGLYMQVPDNISERTYDLVNNITKDCYTSIEKVLAIKRYLTGNYTYELQVSIVPEDREFIDYFLFEEKEGYCTYFNTAMTIMCRMAGVPARYAEGFKTSNKKDDNGMYMVTNADAHAWCEVLLGAYEYSNMWTIVDASPTANEDAEKKLKELQDKGKNEGNSGNVNINMNRKLQKPLEDIESKQGEVVAKSLIFSDKQFRIINILTVCILYMLTRILKVAKRRNKLLASKKIAPLYNYYLDRLAVVRIIKQECEGDLEFIKEIKNDKLKERMETLVKSAYEEFYGNYSNIELNNKDYYEFIEKYLKERQGKFAYFLNKYLGY